MQILIIGKVWPEPKSSAAGRRMIQLISFFEMLGEVVFVTSAAKTGFEAELKVRNQLIKLNDVSFDVFVKQLNPSIVVFDRFITEEQFSWRIKDCCPDALRILNTEDLHFLRKAREKAMKENGSFSTLDFNEENTYREIASIHKSDVTLLVSDFEVDLLQQEFSLPSTYLFHLPIFSSGLLLNSTEFENRKDLLFIGNFLHAPNLDAVRYLKTAFWPAFRKLRKDISIHIYGAYPTLEVLQMNSEKDQFFVHGRAEDVSDVMRKARICIAPLRFGAGIKGKIIDAMEAGLPVLTTSIGAEGIADGNSFPGFISDEFQTQIENVCRLYDDQELWESKRELGGTLLTDKFKADSYLPKFRLKILNCLGNLDEHRKKSFESNLIQYHSFQNSKFFSRWISEKRK